MGERIRANDALETMRARAGRSADSIGLALGHARTWLGNIRGRDPQLTTVAAVAEVTGHEVALLDAESGEVVATIEPPEPSGRRSGRGRPNAEDKDHKGEDA